MMRDCEFYEIHLAEYAGDQLPADRRAAVDDHLAGCADCRAELARERELLATLSSLPLAPCPDRIVDALHEKLDLGRGTAPVVPLRRPWARLASAGLVAAALAVMLLVPVLRQDAPLGAAPGTDSYTQAEIDQARRDVIAVLALTADVLDRSSQRTMSDVFGDRLPGAVTGSLRRPVSHDAQSPNGATGATDTGGQG